MISQDSSTMFAHIVSRLTNRTEDVAVEALGFILSRSDSARRALRDLLQPGGLNVGELTDAKTQVRDETLARPDLAGDKCIELGDGVDGAMDMIAGGFVTPDGPFRVRRQIDLVCHGAAGPRHAPWRGVRWWRTFLANLRKFGSG